MTSLTVVITVGIFLAGLLLSIIGYLLNKDNKALTNRVQKNEDDLDALRVHLEDKICSSNREVLAAIRELSKSSVHKNDCESKQKLLQEQRDGWIKIQELKAEQDARSHKDIISTIVGLTDHIDTLSKCITALQNEKPCEA